MFRLSILPLALFGALAVLVVVIPAAIEAQERRRIARVPPRRTPFRPLLIQGGKPQAPPAIQVQSESHTA